MTASLEQFAAIGRPIVTGFEATGDYHSTLAHRLLTAGFGLRLISSVALARTREALHNGWDKNAPKVVQVILHMLRIGATRRYPATSSDGHAGDAPIKLPHNAPIFAQIRNCNARERIDMKERVIVCRQSGNLFAITLIDGLEYDTDIVFGRIRPDLTAPDVSVIRWTYPGQIMDINKGIRDVVADNRLQHVRTPTAGIRDKTDLTVASAN